MPRKQKKLILLIALLLMLIIVWGYDIMNHSISSKKVSMIINDFKESEIIEITAMIDSIQHGIIIKEDLIEEFKNNIFNVDWDLVSDRSFISYGDTSFRIFISGNTEVSDIHIIGKKYMLISVYDFEKNKSETYKLEVNWLNDSYEQIKYIVRESR